MASTSGCSPNATVDAKLSGFQKTVCLYDWWLIKAAEDFEGKKLAVGGVTSREYPEKIKSSSTRRALRAFTSSPIIKRRDAFCLDTADEICVVLKGLINKERTMGNGFSSEVFKHFIFGFPPQWERRAVEHMGQEPVNDVAALREVVVALNCGDVMNPDGDNMRKSNKLLQPPVEPNTSSTTHDLKRKHNTKEGSSNGKTKRIIRTNHSKVISEERRNTQILKECLKHAHEVSTDDGIIEEGCQQTCDVEQEQNCGGVMNEDGGSERNSNTLLRPPLEPGIATSTPGLRRKKNAKQGTSKSKIKRKIDFDTPGRSRSAEANKSMSKVSPDAPSFKRSRSGRHLIPHMEYWRNQVPVYDRDRSITGILEDSLVTPLRGSKTEPPKMRR